MPATISAAKSPLSVRRFVLGRVRWLGIGDRSLSVGFCGEFMNPV